MEKTITEEEIIDELYFFAISIKNISFDKFQTVYGVKDSEGIKKSIKEILSLKE